MKRIIWVLVLLGVAGLTAMLALRKPPPPEVRFAAAAREEIVATLTTNGKAEPADWSPVRADKAGRIERLHVAKGARVAAGAPLVTLDAQEDRDAVARAEARLAQAQADVALFDAGGRAQEKASLDASLHTLEVETAQLRRDIEGVNRLLEKKAATTREKQELEDRLAKVEAEAAGLKRRRAALTDTSEQAAAQARLREAQAALESARTRLGRNVVSAPRAGVVYQLPVRAGTYLQPGDLIAEIGDLDRMRVIVFVDEPELGRVKPGMPVTITWDGAAGHEWSGSVERLPAVITAQANRNIGEVQTLVDNPHGDLVPGANINARILTARVEKALSVPKECLAREKGEPVVYVLSGNRVERRPVKLGVSNLARAEVLSGLKEGELAAILTDLPLAAGQEVRRVE